MVQARNRAMDVARMAGWEFSVRSSCSAGPSAMSVASEPPSVASAIWNTSLRGAPGEGLAHAHGLRALTGEDERQTHAVGLLEVSLERPYAAGALRPPGATRTNRTKPAAPAVWNMCKDARICRHGGPIGPGQACRGASSVTSHRRSQGLLDPVVEAARSELGAAGLPGDQILVLRAIWRDLVTGSPPS